jgi:predicted alpha/beta-fold hydrolase
LPDGDKISLEIATPSQWKEDDLTVVLVHGLCGSHESPYLVRLANRLDSLGIRSVRFNMRGCGSGKGLARNIYHSGRSEDLFYAIRALNKEKPHSPIILIGFSLGGNITLKMVGELHQIAGRFLEKAFAICPPVDLLESVHLIEHEQNAMYEKYFYKILRNEVYYLHKTFKDLPPIHLPKNLKLREFDRIYTVPRCGFSDSLDYYTKCSSLHFVGDITIPCKILLSEDDPIVSSHSLDEQILPSNVEVYKTKKGGHMGYLGNPSHERGFHWLDSILVEWILEK